MLFVPAPPPAGAPIHQRPGLTATFGRLWPYLWPEGRPDLQRRSGRAEPDDEDLEVRDVDDDAETAEIPAGVAASASSGGEARGRRGIGALRRNRARR